MELINICNGISQGNPLLMILYIIYNADLLEMLVLLLEEDSIGYIDDAIAIAFSKDFHEMTQAPKCMMEREDRGLA